MSNRHEAALRAALAERKRLIGWIGVCTSILPPATDYVLARIVKAALAAADAPMTKEQRKAIAKRFGMGWSDGAYVVCDRYYPKCCSYHEGFDDALAEMPVLAAADAHDEGPCRTCGGQGWITVAEHGCDGNEELCDELCPVPAQAQCPECAQREPEASVAEPW